MMNPEMLPEIQMQFVLYTVGSLSASTVVRFSVFSLLRRP